MSNSKLKSKSTRSRSKSSSNSHHSSQSQIGGFPDSERVKLVYTGVVTRAPTGAAGTDYVFSGNGLFDPDITGTGVQPINYDDFSAVYSRYRCYGSSIMVNSTSPGSITGTGNMWVAVAARHTTTAKTAWSDQVDAAGQPNAIGRFFYAGLDPTKSYQLSKTTAKVLGYDAMAIRDDDTLQALTSANPAHQWYWHIMTSMSDQSSTGAIYHYVKITYDVEFFDRIDTSSDSIIRVPKSLVQKVHDLVKVMSPDDQSREQKESKAPPSGGWRLL